MPCHYPKTLFQDISPGTGELCSRWTPVPFYELDDFDRSKHFRVMPVPCGHCLGCAADRARLWTDRLCLEFDHTKKAVFITLTYNDKYLPFVFEPAEDGSTLAVPTLVKRDLQLFLKRLRRDFAPTELRFFACGEYGGLSARPHLHMIVFGSDLSDWDPVPWSKNEFGQPVYLSQRLEDIWSSDLWTKDNKTETRGFSTIAPVSIRTMSYVAHYTTKKMAPSGDDNPNIYYASVQPEFAQMSRRPGIAGYFLVDHPEFDGDIRWTYLDPQDPSQSRDINLPRYVLDRFDDPSISASVRERRMLLADGLLTSQLAQTDMTPSEFLNSLEASDRTRMNKKISRKF